MQSRADYAEKLEIEWHSKLYDYQSKYPKEAAEFEALLYGGTVPGWENSLPVNHLHFGSWSLTCRYLVLVKCAIIKRNMHGRTSNCIEKLKNHDRLRTDMATIRFITSSSYLFFKSLLKVTKVHDPWKSTELF